MAIDIVDFPIKNGGSFHCYVSSPEGTMFWLVLWNMNLVFPIILGISSSQLTFTPSFFRGVGQPPTRLLLTIINQLTNQPDVLLFIFFHQQCRCHEMAQDQRRTDLMAQKQEQFQESWLPWSIHDPSMESKLYMGLLSFWGTDSIYKAHFWGLFLREYPPKIWPKIWYYCTSINWILKISHWHDFPISESVLVCVLVGHGTDVLRSLFRLWHKYSQGPAPRTKGSARHALLGTEWTVGGLAFLLDRLAGSRFDSIFDFCWETTERYGNYPLVN